MKMHKANIMAGMCIFSGIVLLNSNELITISLAKNATNSKSNITNQVVLKEVVDEYNILNTYNEDFESYLVKRGINASDYKSCVDFYNKHKDDKIGLLFEIENLMQSFDTILYTNNIVKNIYKSNLDRFKNKDVAWDETVKGLIYDDEWLCNIYDENILKRLDIKKLFEYRFKRHMTKNEEDYAKDPKNLIYILYSGNLERDLEKEEVELIKNGKGYELLEITAKEYKEYQNYISKLTRILSLSDRYIKSYKVHEKVRDSIKIKYKLDIYTVLNDDDRESVYNKSLVNYVYNEEDAKKIFIDILTGRGLISQGSQGTGGSNGGTGSGGSNGGTGSGGSSNVPQKPPTSSDSIHNNPDKENGENEDDIAADDNLSDKDYEYLEEVLKPLGGNSQQIIHNIKNNKYTSTYYAKLGSMINLYNMNVEKKILAVDIGDRRIYTLVEMTENTLSSDDFRTVMNQIVIEGVGKLIESEKEILLFVNNAIDTIEKKDENYSIGEINDSMKNTKVKWSIVSLKDAMKDYVAEMAQQVSEE